MGCGSTSMGANPVAPAARFPRWRALALPVAGVVPAQDSSLPSQTPLPSQQLVKGCTGCTSGCSSDEEDLREFCPHRPHAAIVGRFGVQIMRLDTRDEVGMIHSLHVGHEYRDVVQSQLFGRPVLAAACGRRILFIERGTWRRSRKMMGLHRGHRVPIKVLCDLPSSFGGGDLIASGSDRSVRLVRKSTRKEIACHVVQKVDEIRISHHSLCCVPERRWLVWGSGDAHMRGDVLGMKAPESRQTGRTVVWDCETQTTVTTSRYLSSRFNVNAVAFGSHCKCIFVGSHGVDMISLDELRYVGSVGRPIKCRSVLLHPHNEFHLFVGDSHGQISRWDLRSRRQPVQVRRVHGGRVRQIVHVGADRFGSCCVSGVKVWGDRNMREVGPESSKLRGVRGLCSLVPFDECVVASDADAVPLEERMQFLLVAFSNNASILFSSLESSRRCESGGSSGDPRVSQRCACFGFS